jgi:antitoxin (DNA-binding transcriptional repressor) of toxin-antitoxin stability system
MRAVGLKTLKNRLSEFVRLVASGETVLVTDRDRVVAELGPPREHRSPMVGDALLAEMVRQGWIMPVQTRRRERPPRAPVGTFDDLMRQLGADRADR